MRVARALFERGQLDTSPVVDLEAVDLAGPGRIGYTPSGWFFMRRAMRGVRIGPHDVFVDFGAGMGRVVCCVARRHAAKRVVGVELAEAFIRIGEQNLSRVRHRLRCENVQFVTSDVLDYDIPDDLTHAYFYNPFTDDVFRQVVDNIIGSIDRNPRSVTLIYANPRMHDALLATGRFEHLRTSRGMWRSRRTDRWVAVYRSRGDVG